jgi:hypothetical protein
MAAEAGAGRGIEHGLETGGGPSQVAGSPLTGLACLAPDSTERTEHLLNGPARLPSSTSSPVTVPKPHGLPVRLLARPPAEQERTLKNNSLLYFHHGFSHLYVLQWPWSPLLPTLGHSLPVALDWPPLLSLLSPRSLPPRGPSSSITWPVLAPLAAAASRPTLSGSASATVPSPSTCSLLPPRGLPSVLLPHGCQN